MQAICMNNYNFVCSSTPFIITISLSEQLPSYNNRHRLLGELQTTMVACEASHQNGKKRTKTAFTVDMKVIF